MIANKTIYLVRHAKSSWYQRVTSDFERPLSDRGIADAIRMGDTLNSLGWKPEKILSSPAIRAKQTCEIFCDKLTIPLDNINWKKDIYAAYTVTLLQLLSAQNESLKSIMLIGHNPSMEDLLLHLCHDALSHRQKNGKLLTTGNVVKITLSTSWKEIAMSDATLVKILRPKAL